MENCIIRNSYNIIKLLDSGGNSNVWLGISDDKKLYAIKESILYNFKELDISMRLPSHENLMKFVTFFFDKPISLREYKLIESKSRAKISNLSSRVEKRNDVLYYVMECGEMNLIEYMILYDVKMRDKVHILLQIAEAIEYLHSNGIYHLDIKPGNIIMYGKRPVLCDYGLASYITDVNCVMSCYTITFSAPEIIRKYHRKNITGSSEGPIDFNLTEIWSFGILMLSFLVNQEFIWFSPEGEARKISNFIKILNEKYINNHEEFIRKKLCKIEYCDMWVSLTSKMCYTLPSSRISSMKEVILSLKDILNTIDKISIVDLEMLIPCNEDILDNITTISQYCELNSLRAITFFNAVDLFYRTHRIYYNKFLCIACVTISSNLHDDGSCEFNSKEYYGHNDKTIPEILRILNGKLNYPTLYDYAKSKEDLYVAQRIITSTVYEEIFFSDKRDIILAKYMSTYSTGHNTNKDIIWKNIIV